MGLAECAIVGLVFAAILLEWAGMGGMIVSLVITMILLAVVGLYIYRAVNRDKAEDELLDDVDKAESDLAAMKLERDRALLDLAASEHQYNTLNEERIQLVHYAEELVAKLRRTTTVPSGQVDQKSETADDSETDDEEYDDEEYEDEEYEDEEYEDEEYDDDDDEEEDDDDDDDDDYHRC